jgi:formimidoylglutamate deiminase
LESKSVIAPYALLPEGWAKDVRIDIDANGTITGITPDSPTHDASLLGGPVIPGMPNVHSHAFQRAFAGQAEHSQSGADSFWTWREAMYGLAGRITPDRLEAIAAQLYVEMLESGYTSVGEFHYLHHDRGGVPFATRSEMAQRILAASDATGIGLTLLPVLYRYSGFGNKPPLPEQARFITDVDTFVQLFDELAPLCNAPGKRLGIAPHSLRAVGADDLRDVLAAIQSRDPHVPIHMHVAEQNAEVVACVEHTGLRPVQWLLENARIDARWCLVHATHMNAAEITALAASRAAVALCPSTEANLGDGIFALERWANAGGATAIGSDSHVCIDVAEELRWLEYGQRLRWQRRTISPSLTALYQQCARDGGTALGRTTGVLASGYSADLVVLDTAKPALAGGKIDTLLDRYIISGSRRCVRDVFVCGKQVVMVGKHPSAESVFARFRAAVGE